MRKVLFASLGVLALAGCGSATAKSSGIGTGVTVPVSVEDRRPTITVPPMVTAPVPTTSAPVVTVGLSGFNEVALERWAKSLWPGQDVSDFVATVRLVCTVESVDAIIAEMMDPSFDIHSTETGQLFDAFYLACPVKYVAVEDEIQRRIDAGA